MQIVIEIWEEGAGVITAGAHCKNRKNAPEDVKLYTAMLLARLEIMVPMVAEEFCAKMNLENQVAKKKKKKSDVKVVSA